jgi:hypothetical protein
MCRDIEGQRIHHEESIKETEVLRGQNTKDRGTAAVTGDCRQI